MGKVDKIRASVMSGSSDANISFADLCLLLGKLGFNERAGKGSHRLFTHGQFFINLQADGNKAKSYQVRQVRDQLRKLGHQS
jgi:hypothetical protein